MYRRVSGHVLRWSARATSASSSNAPSTAQSAMKVSSRSSTPGTLRVTKGYGADKHEAELNSTLARIIGSDWGDRSRQPVSLPMRIYWVVFAVVLGNGLYTYFTGKDESFLVEKLKKKADEKLGVQEDKNEFLAMVDGPEKDRFRAAPTVSAESRGSSSGMPFIMPGRSPRHPKSQKELAQQLAQLRVQQERLQKQIRSSEGAAKDELEHQVRMADIQKEQVKLQIERL